MMTLEEYVPNPIAVPLLPPRRRAAATAGGHPRRRPPPTRRFLAEAIAAVTIVVGVLRIATDTTAYLNRLCHQNFFSASVLHRYRRYDDDVVIAAASNDADEAEREEEASAVSASNLRFVVSNIQRYRRLAPSSFCLR
jgi:hypothetical protein